ncbi:MAG: hypothetical protein SVC26_06760 [Pseudomonadota bacterium]|nr:hypothetical protein [Pseudomonadota bacterium]
MKTAIIKAIIGKKAQSNDKATVIASVATTATAAVCNYSSNYYGDQVCKNG